MIIIGLVRPDLAVHVVLSLDELASVHLSSVGLTGHDVTLSLMQDLDGYSDGHFSTVSLKHNMYGGTCYVLSHNKIMQQ